LETERLGLGFANGNYYKPSRKRKTRKKPTTKTEKRQMNPKKRTKNSSIYDITRCIDRFRERRMDGRFVADGESLFPIYENMRMEDRWEVKSSDLD
jgi:hypothetical protein